MLNFAFYEDSFRYNPFDATFSQPTLIFQGMQDTFGGSADRRSIRSRAAERHAVAARRRSSVDERACRSIWDGVSAFLEVK